VKAVENRINEEMNIAKIMRELRYINIILRSSLMTKDILFEIEHSE